MGSHPANLTLRFLLELAALAGLGFLGYLASFGWPRFLLAAALPLGAAAVWGTFAVPDDPSRSGNAPVPVAGWLRLLIELAIFGLGIAGLATASKTVALGVLVLVILHYALSVDRIRWLIAG